MMFSCKVLSVNPLKCGLMNNQEWRARPEVTKFNCSKPLPYPYSIKINKGSGSCMDINDPYAKLRVPDVFEGINAKAFDLTSRTNETRYMGWHEACRCKCRLNASVCNNKNRQNKGKRRRECKELIDKGSSDKGLIWSPSKCGCECDVGEYLDFENCNCRKRSSDTLVQEYNEYIGGNTMIYHNTLNDCIKACGSCTVHIVLIVVVF